MEKSTELHKEINRVINNFKNGKYHKCSPMLHKNIFLFLELLMEENNNLINRMFITLKQNKKPIIVNSNNIVYFHPFKGAPYNSLIKLIGDEIYVDETLEQIQNLINNKMENE